MKLIIDGKEAEFTTGIIDYSEKIDECMVSEENIESDKEV